MWVQMCYGHLGKEAQERRPETLSGWSCRPKRQCQQRFKPQGRLWSTKILCFVAGAPWQHFTFVIIFPLCVLWILIRFGWLVGCPAFPTFQRRKQKDPPLTSIPQQGCVHKAVGSANWLLLLMDEYRTSAMKKPGSLGLVATVVAVQGLHCRLAVAVIL